MLNRKYGESNLFFTEKRFRAPEAKDTAKHHHPDTGRILFLTDTYLCEHTFPGLNHIIIEANYADDILEENIFRGIEHPSKRERLLTSHMELETTKAVLMAQDLSRVENVVLIHLSDRNSDERRFVEEVKGVTGKAITAGKDRMEINFDK